MRHNRVWPLLNRSPFAPAGTLAIGICLSAGCSVGPDYRPPSPQVADQWHEPAIQGLADGQADVSQWWRVFEDQQLSQLIDRAAAGNRDRRLAMRRSREARALRGVAAGELLPTLGGQGSYLRAKASPNGPTAFPESPGAGQTFGNTVGRGIAGQALGAGLAAAAPGATAVTGPLASGLIGLVPTPTGRPQTDETNLHAAGFDASWEIDVFGGIRRNVESADAAVQASVESYRDTLVTLLAEVATTYVDIRTLQSQIKTTANNIALQRETLSLTKARLSMELASELEVQQAETNLATTESQLPQIESGLAISIYRLSVLIGEEPSALSGEFAATSGIPQPPPQVLVGVPTDILRRRPDIRLAERQLAEQTARIGVATAELYPRFTLSGTFGLESTNFEDVLDARSITYGFGPAVQWNLFSGLRSLNQIAAQEAATHQAYVIYERTLLNALQEVESSLVAYKREQARVNALERAVDAAEKSVKLAETLYRNGLTDFENVLDTQRLLVNLQNTRAQSRGQVSTNLVSVYKALGGGWSAEVTPQHEYLDAESPALSRPVEFFFSGGKGPLPWETPPQSTEDED